MAVSLCKCSVPLYPIFLLQTKHKSARLATSCQGLWFGYIVTSGAETLRALPVHNDVLEETFSWKRSKIRTISGLTGNTTKAK